MNEKKRLQDEIQRVKQAMKNTSSFYLKKDYQKHLDRLLKKLEHIEK